jgi:magnesium-transporting ATPase (P-type)
VERVHVDGRDIVKIRLVDEMETLANKFVFFSFSFFFSLKLMKYYRDHEEIRHDLAGEILHTHEFSSARKYMSTIIRPQGYVVFI